MLGRSAWGVAQLSPDEALHLLNHELYLLWIVQVQNREDKESEWPKLTV
jgi:hypothetical protein